MNNYWKQLWKITDRSANGIKFKGFDKNLKARNYQYQVGETFTEDVTPEVCNTGFHFCDSLEDVFDWYEFNQMNRFCLVEPQGEISRSQRGGKHSTNKLKIIRELEMDEILYHGNRAKFQIDTFYDLFVSSKHPSEHIAIGGSLSLIINRVIPPREIKDMDIVIYDEEVFDKMKAYLKKYISNERKSAMSNAGHDKEMTLSVNNGDYRVNFDVFLVKNFNKENAITAKMGFPLHPPLNIMQAKFFYCKRAPYAEATKKHMQDLLQGDYLTLKD